MKHFWAVLCVVVAWGLAGTQPAGASGLKTHLWIAQEIINDLRPDCAVSLAGEQYAIPEETCRAILDNPTAFLAGALGPDAYPDIIAGQLTAHPGIDGGWQTSDWLRHVYLNARSPAEVAFSAGYLVHAATDTFAHTYVNGYAGDIFELGDERAVELRHFVLEKYIDAHLPVGSPDPRTLNAPDGFIARTLILNEDAASNSRRAGAFHISAMYEVYDAVGDLEKNLDDIEELAGEVLSTLLLEQVEVTAKLADGEIALGAADVALSVREQQLQIEQAAFDTAKNAFDDAVDAVEANENLITLSEQRAQAASVAITTARNVASEANNTIGSLNTQLLDLRARIADVPRETCRNVQREICRNLPWPLDEACRVVTDVVCEVTSAWSQLSNQIIVVERRLEDARHRLHQAGISETTNAALRANALQAKLEAEGRKAALSGVRVAAEVAYEPVRLRYELELKATGEARTVVQNIRDEIERFRTRLLDIDRMKQAIAEMVADSDVLSGYAHNWRRGIEVATEKYIEVGTKNVIGLTTGDGGGFAAYREWLKCYGGAFTPVPYQAGEFVCNAESEWERFNARLDQLIIELLPEPFSSLYKQYLDLRSEFRARVGEATSNALVELAKMAAPDQSTREFIDLLANPQNATASRLNSIYSEVGDSGGKALLTFERVTDLINADAGIIGDGPLNPRSFAPMAHSGTLSRYALLDQQGVDLVTWRLGGEPTASASSEGSRYSVLFEMLRSIDGNHQWQPFGLPFARSDGPPVPADAQERHFGWGPADSGPRGLPIFINETNRRRVFGSLFSAVPAGALADRPELNGSYPFPQCDHHPFPVTFNQDGSPAVSDRACDTAPVTPVFEEQRATVTRWWRGVLYSVGLGPEGASDEAREAAKREAEQTNLHPQAP